MHKFVLGRAVENSFWNSYLFFNLNYQLKTTRHKTMSSAYVKSVETVLSQNANPDNAISMKKYMKDKFEFYGIQTTPRRNLTKKFLTKDSLPSMDKLSDIIKELWGMPQREFHYFGVELMEKFTSEMNRNSLPLIEFTITEKSWWDTVDGIATKIVGEMFRKRPELILPVTEKWMVSGNIWLQRSALLFQLKYKSETDTDLLFRYIQELEGSKEFFINKAIGWALREYSKTDPARVLGFVNGHNLAPLSKREALKVINKSVQ